MANEELTAELFELLDTWKLSDEQVEQASSLLERGADPNYCQADYPTESILYRALKTRKNATRLAMVERLILHGVDLNLETNGSYPLWHAVMKNDLSLISLFIENKVQKGLDTGLKLAIEKDYVEIVRTLVPLIEDLNPDPNDSFLSYCCEAYRCRDAKKEYDSIPGMASARFLIESGVRVDDSPLFSAIQHDFVEFAQLLLQHGATLEQASTHQPALFTARSPAMAQLLIDAGADINVRDNYGNTLLMHQFMNVDMEMVEFIIDKGVDLYAVNDEGATAFHSAARCESPKVLDQLIKHYDVKRCDEILPLMTYLDDCDPRVLTYIGKKLGIEQADSSPLSMDELVTPELRAMDAAFEARASRLAAEIISTSPGSADQLPKFEDFLTKSVMDQLLEELNENLEEWSEECEGESLRALYLEYSGHATAPFDGMALFWGYESCDDSLSFKKELFEAGSLNLSVFFDGISEVIEDFDDSYTEINSYYEAIAFRYVHLAFGRLARTEAFQSLPIQAPFYVVGGAHDQERQLIFKLP